MFTFLLKRRFVKDIEFAIYDVHAKTAAGAPSIDGYTLNKPAMMRKLSAWLRHEKAALDSFNSGRATDIGMATHRARVWVGIHLVHGAFEYGAPSIPKRSIKKFYKPSAIVAMEYFKQLKRGSSQPFSVAFKSTFDDALDRTMA